MKKSYFFLITILISCRSGDPNEFAEFYVDDVTKEQEFMDSTSALAGKLAFKSHEKMVLRIEGELDSGALIQFYSFPDHNWINEFDLVKGNTR